MSSTIVFYKNGSLYLDTNLTENSFSRTLTAERQNEKGVIAERTKDGWSFSPWHFTGTTTNSQVAEKQEEFNSRTDTVLLYAECFEGRTLKQLFDEEKSTSSEEAKKNTALATAFLCSATEAAFTQKVKLPNNGGGGLYFNSSFTKLLYLPQENFDTAAAALGQKIYREQNGYYLFRSLTLKKALRYTESVAVYRTLTGSFPFENEDSVQKYEDMLDHNFIRLSEAVYGIDQKLAFFIDTYLSRRPVAEAHEKPLADKKPNLWERIRHAIVTSWVKHLNKMEDRHTSSAGSTFPLAELYKELGLNSEGTLEGSTLNAPERKSDISIEEFKQNVEKAQAKRKASINRSRWFRRNQVRIIFSTCAVIFLAVLGHFIAMDTLHNPTSKSLTAEQTVEVYYASINAMDTNTMKTVSRGDAAESMQYFIGNYYINTNQRAILGTEKQTVDPATWIFNNGEDKFRIFGITKLEIQGKPADIYATAPQKINYPKAVTKPDGTPYKNGDTCMVEATYYFITTEAPVYLKVLTFDDVLTLTWKKDRWVITAIHTPEAKKQQEVRAIEWNTFCSDYENAFSSSKGNISKTIESLSEKYNFISTIDEVNKAYKKFVRSQI